MACFTRSPAFCLSLGVCASARPGSKHNANVASALMRAIVSRPLLEQGRELFDHFRMYATVRCDEAAPLAQLRVIDGGAVEIGELAAGSDQDGLGGARIPHLGLGDRIDVEVAH